MISLEDEREAIEGAFAYYDQGLDQEWNAL
jgi:hypothetical protein